MFRLLLNPDKNSNDRGINARSLMTYCFRSW